MMEASKPNPVVSDLMNRALKGATPLAVIYPPEAIASAREMLMDVEKEIKELFAQKAAFLSFDAPLEERMKDLISDARAKMPANAQFISVKPYDLQFHEHSEKVDHPDIAHLLAGMGEVMGQSFNNVLSRRVAASMALTKWVQKIDPKCRIEISTNDEEVKKWWDRTILNMIIER